MSYLQRQIAWHPENADVGTHIFSIFVTDSQGAVDEQSIELTVINTNDAPTLQAIDNQFIDEGNYFSIPIDATDDDIGDVLTSN